MSICSMSAVCMLAHAGWSRPSVKLPPADQDIVQSLFQVLALSRFVYTPVYTFCAVQIAVWLRGVT